MRPTPADRGGYSGTALVRKLGVKPGATLVLSAAPVGWDIPDLPAGVERPEGADAATGPIDVCVAFCRHPDELRAAVTTFAEAIRPAGALWIAWPRRAAGHRSEVTENLIREVVLPLGLVDTKVAALDVDWSGLKVVWRRERR